MDLDSRTLTPYPVSVPYPLASRYSLSTQRLCLVLWLITTDAVALWAAMRVAYWARFHLKLTLAPEVPLAPEYYATLLALLVPLWVIVFVLFNLYDTHAKLGGLVESSRTFNACTTATMVVILGTFLLRDFGISRAWLVLVWLLSFVFVTLNRIGARRIVYGLRSRGFLLTPAAIVGTNQEAASMAAFLAEWQKSGLRMVGFVATRERSPDDHTVLPLLGDTSEILRLIDRHGIEDLIVAITGIGREELLDLCEEVSARSHTELRLSSGLYELLTTRVTVRTLGTVPLLSLHKNRLDRHEMVLKSTFEWTVTALGVLLLSPLLLVIAALVKLDSPGPALYRRRVVGVSGRTFDALKFRTMHVNGAELLLDRPDAIRELESNHKLRDDPRVTRVGCWLRRYSLDELPQLLNVLFGQMSLVGPRMITTEEMAKYGRQRLNLLSVKPGITGLWQVSGRSDLSYEERVKIDMYYVRNYSIWLDFQILFVRTLPAVLKGRGAY